MSLWNEKYDERYQNCSSQNNPMGLKEYINKNLSKRIKIVTMYDVESESKRLEIEYKEKQKELRQERGKIRDSILVEYQKELFDSYPSIPNSICLIAYNAAYEDKHSYGMNEVEDSFDNLVAMLHEAYLMGVRSCKSKE